MIASRDTGDYEFGCLRGNTGLRSVWTSAKRALRRPTQRTWTFIPLRPAIIGATSTKVCTNQKYKFYRTVLLRLKEGENS